MSTDGEGTSALQEEEVRRRLGGGSSDRNASEVKGSAVGRCLLKVRTGTTSMGQEKWGGEKNCVLCGQTCTASCQWEREAANLFKVIFSFLLSPTLFIPVNLYLYGRPSPKQL